MPATKILVTALDAKGHVLYPYRILDSNIAKLQKLTLDVPATESPLVEDEIHVMQLYQKFYVAYLCNGRQELSFYRFAQDQFVKDRTCNLFSVGEFRISVVDSLVIVHNIEHKLSMTFDISVKQDSPVCPPLSIAPYKKYYVGTDVNNEEPESVDLYSPDWLYASPNFIIDKKTGFMFELHIFLNDMPISIRKRTEVIRFLFRRVNSKIVLLKRLKKFIETKDSLANITPLFNLLNAYCRIKAQSQQLSPHRIPESVEDEDTFIVISLGYPVIDQSDLYTHVFIPLDEEKVVSKQTIVSLIVEYIRSLNHYVIPVQHYIQRFLIEVLLKNKNYNLLHHYIQYKVISDNKPTALQIYSISNEYKPAYQIALDMLSRLQAYDTICEILLSRNEVCLFIMHLSILGFACTSNHVQVLQCCKD
jgi:hypothetical protein